MIRIPIFQGVMERGQGQWAEIKTWGHFHHRTSVNLKDKWRTLGNQPGRLKGVIFISAIQNTIKKLSTSFYHITFHQSGDSQNVFNPIMQSSW